MNPVRAVLHFQVRSKAGEVPIVSTRAAKIKDPVTGKVIPEVKLPPGMIDLMNKAPGQFSNACRKPMANPDGDGFTVWLPMVNCPECMATDEYRAEAIRTGHKG